METPISDKHFVPVNPCRKGHYLRLKSTGACIPCSKQKAREWIERNRESIREKDKKRRGKYKERRLAQNRASKKKNLEKRVAYNRDWRQRNPDKASKHSFRWRQKNPGKVLARVRKRQTALMQRMPKWANQDAIRHVYEEAKRLEAETGIRYHVDHIVPLQGKTVSGLHVEYNLQLLTPKQNRLKHNKWDA